VPVQVADANKQNAVHSKSPAKVIANLPEDDDLDEDEL